jgi:hypothetical protein
MQGNKGRDQTGKVILDICQQPDRSKRLEWIDAGLVTEVRDRDDRDMSREIFTKHFGVAAFIETGMVEATDLVDLGEHFEDDMLIIPEGNRTLFMPQPFTHPKVKMLIRFPDLPLK